MRNLWFSRLFGCFRRGDSILTYSERLSETDILQLIFASRFLAWYKVKLHLLVPFWFIILTGLHIKFGLSKIPPGLLTNHGKPLETLSERT